MADDPSVTSRRGVSDIAKMFDRGSGASATPNTGTGSPGQLRTKRMSTISSGGGIHEHVGIPPSAFSPKPSDGHTSMPKDHVRNHSMSVGSRVSMSSAEVDDVEGGEAGVVYEDRMPVARLSRIFDTTPSSNGLAPPSHVNGKPVTSVAARARQLSAVASPKTSTANTFPKSSSVGSIARTIDGVSPTPIRKPPPSIAPKPANLLAKTPNLSRSTSVASNPFIGSDDSSSPSSPTIPHRSSSPDPPPSSNRVSERIAALSDRIHAHTFLSIPLRPGSDLPTTKKKPPPPPPPSRPSLQPSHRHSTTDDDLESRASYASEPDTESRSSIVRREDMSRRISRNGAAPRPLLGVPSMGREGSTDSSYISGVVSDDGSAMSDSFFSKREKIVSEIVETEKRFLADMHTLKEVDLCYTRLRNWEISASDCKILFFNLDGVIDISTVFLRELEMATESEPFMIGEAFLKHTLTADYCRNNEAAIAKIGELLGPDSPQSVRDFLKRCQIQLQGKTGAWDLSSLVIKPVQRVLKYPLLIKETPSSDPDYANLLKCSTDVEKVAENINEYKKRKDTVEKYVEGKSKINVMHGITKKITRGVQEVTKKVSAMLKDELRYWLRSIKDFVERQMQLAEAFEEVYEMGSNDIRGAGYKFVAVEYRKACEWLAANSVKAAESQINGSIVPVLQTLDKMFKDLAHVIKKRAKKKLDYERKRAIEAKGDAKPDRALELSADEYLALHAELLDELPKFLSLALKYFDTVMIALVGIQTSVHMEVRNKLEPVAENFLSTRSSVSPYSGKRRSIVVGTRSSAKWPQGEVIGRWREGFEGDGSGEMRSIVENMSVLDEWRMNVLDNPDWKAPEMLRRNTQPKSAKGTLSPKQSRKVSGGSDITGGVFRFPSKSGGSSPKTTAPSSRRVSITVVGAQPMDAATASLYGTTPTTATRQVEEDENSSRGGWEEWEEQTENNVDEEEAAGRSVGFEADVVFAFTAEMDDELAMEAGDRVWVDLCGGRGGDPSEDWWHGHRVDERV
ncbi:hypothetical protein BC829DRAFT_404977 [Chytridium lagenaria]|nr:hypothetical protein BC829DRAFT_404977 [Chytridium lagenaria]